MIRFAVIGASSATETLTQHLENCASTMLAHLCNRSEVDAAFQNFCPDVVGIEDSPQTVALTTVLQLRARGLSVPVVFITRLPSSSLAVQALDAGADDCVSVTISPIEFGARLRALKRRTMREAAQVKKIGGLSLDVVGRVAYLDGRPLSLTSRELLMLTMLFDASDRAVTKARVVRHLFDQGIEISENAVEVLIYRLRRKLGDGNVRIVAQKSNGGFRLACSSIPTIVAY